MPSSTLTPARRTSLEVVGRHGHARIGTGMYDCTDTDPVITPAAESWLIAQGYVERQDSDDGTKRVELTEAGLTAFHQLPHDTADGDDPGDEPIDSIEDRAPGQQDIPDVVPIGAIPPYAGQAPSGLDTSFAGKVGTLRHVPIGERVITISVSEGSADGHKNTARDGIRATQKLKNIETYEIAGPLADRLINNVREAWHSMTAPDVLPFKQAGDNALVDALGLGERDAVVVVFAAGTRSLWPDDFPKGSMRPATGERLDVPGSKEQDIVVELIEHATGRTVAVFDDEDDVAAPVDAGDEEG